MSFRFPINRTPEEGHTKECMAKAMITAIENIRDQDGQTDIRFVLDMQDNRALYEAREYLNDGMTICLCEPISLAPQINDNDNEDHDLYEDEASEATKHWVNQTDPGAPSWEE